ncbi:MAG: hypothetical protein Q7S40_19325 [Opitutaceae bacterium]|nr:hypothetical protein [Opitutaceae bacterium]
MKKKKPTRADSREIEKITGASMHTSVWVQVATYGADKIFGGEGAPAHETYLLQLLDPRWSAFVQKIKRRKIRCQVCGAGHHLQVHHPYYKNGLSAWEYPIEDMMLLCDGCHGKQHRKERHLFRMASNRKKKGPNPEGCVARSRNTTLVERARE